MRQIEIHWKGEYVANLPVAADGTISPLAIFQAKITTAVRHKILLYARGDSAAIRHGDYRWKWKTA